MSTFTFLDGTQADGTILGQTTGTKISLYGVTPVIQDTGSFTSAITGAETTSGTITTRVTQIITALRALGVMK